MFCRITILGMVQGVGYRPFAARVANELSISGMVKNSGGIVVIMALGTEEAIGRLVHRLQFPYKRKGCADLPRGAEVTQVRMEPMGEREFMEELKKAGRQELDLPGFFIIKSDWDLNKTLPLIPPDLGVCSDCLQELCARGDRRYRYPLISCVACGPRYSIINRIPYDRGTTVMEDFPMCARCAKEYDGDGRRRHAQTISCHECGPQIAYRKLQRRMGNEQALRTENEQALESAIKALQAGGIVAVKGIGGYQLACIPADRTAVKNLRRLKGREKKPFAVMFHDLSQLKESGRVSAKEEELLCSSARPIVLLDGFCGRFAAEVSGESRYLGAFLPNSPLQSLLTEALGPLIITSCNRSSEPMMTTEEEILDWEPPLLAGMLSHDRRILTPLDDSVTSIVMGKSQISRRSRGYVPMPVWISRTFREPVLAMGGDLKACFGLAAEGSVYLSQYFGDMESFSVMRAYQSELGRMERLFGIRPVRAVCDLHPGYVTARLAGQLKEASAVTEIVRIQHHHAHIGSVMAEHHLTGCIGVAFDGTGYGTDGAVWGSEFLYCSGSEMERMGHLEYTPFCGGDEAARDGELALMCYLAKGKAVYASSRYPLVKAALRHQLQVVLNSSMGRLFDAVSALLGIKKRNGYEGECASALERAANEAKTQGKTPYPCRFEVKEQADGKGRGEAFQTGLCHKKALTALAVPLIQDLLDARSKYPSVTSEELALGFHYATADMVLCICRRIREKTGENKVALGGGVFANRLLLELCDKALKEEGFFVYWNEKVPCNDAGLALGQAWLCGQ